MRLFDRLGDEGAGRPAGAAETVEDFVPEEQRKQPSDWQQRCEKENFLNHKGWVVTGHYGAVYHTLARRDKAHFVV